ncbi:unnamed protein product [Clavelina lepadiformis]|uniref:Uncharacterized protein n=1 Tax=Clavelina lepadiformis TaxID=159417 RepID=A0ABP0GBN9_CLALP
MQDLDAGYCISGIDSGAVCPACEGSVANNNLYCFDGNFGLVRRKTAGIQSAFPRHQERFFCNQVEVDKFMNDYSEQETKLFACIYSTKLSLKRFIIAKIKPWFGIIYQVITICPY